MAHRLVTCPETAHLELIECDDSPIGLLILRCTRFDAPCPVECPRTCAARIDRRERVALETMLEVGDDTELDVLGALRVAR
jgi:hypothetical protein